MHVEFKLPSGAGGQAAHYSCSVLNRELARWRDLYGFEYTTRITYYRLSVTFTDDRAYTLFALSWCQPGVKWQILED
jgi:hypothetical protein